MTAIWIVAFVILVITGFVLWSIREAQILDVIEDMEMRIEDLDDHCGHIKECEKAINELSFWKSRLEKISK